MITIDYFTIQELILNNTEVQKQLLKFNNLFHQWKLGLFAPSLRPMAQKARIELLNRLGSEEIHILEQYYKTTINIVKLDNASVKNQKILIKDLPNFLEINGEMFLHRDPNHIYIGTWT